MQDNEILQSFESLLDNLAIELRYEKGDFAGGLCRYKDKQQLIVNKDLGLQQKINILARELGANLDLDQVYMVPALREVIDNASGVE